MPVRVRHVDRPGKVRRAERERAVNQRLKLVKAADKLSALIKCIEEEKAGNKEFHKAGETLRASVEAMDLEEANIFLKEFLPSYYLTLDELNEN